MLNNIIISNANVADILAEWAIGAELMPCEAHAELMDMIPELRRLWDESGNPDVWAEFERLNAEAERLAHIAKSGPAVDMLTELHSDIWLYDLMEMRGQLY